MKNIFIVVLILFLSFMTYEVFRIQKEIVLMHDTYCRDMAGILSDRPHKIDKVIWDKQQNNCIYIYQDGVSESLQTILDAKAIVAAATDTDSKVK